jgi:anionic cell wall polymer biosynthesis LytR-Cps2A-Psr (LCP) family protein
MCVDERTTSVHFDKAGKYHTMIERISDRKVYEKGCRDMAAYEALDFARQRYNVTGGDYGRQKHQQQLLMAIFKKLTSKGVMSDPGTLVNLQKAAGDLLTMDLGKTEVTDWLFTLKSLSAESVVMIRTNGGIPNPAPSGSNELLTDDSMKLLKAVHDDTVFDFVVKHPTWIASDK